MSLRFFGLVFFYTVPWSVNAQPVIAGFNSPDSTCVNETVTIINTSTGGTTYYWNFCSGNANNNPAGINIGNPGGLLNIPVYPTLAQDGNDCFTFIPNQGAGVRLVRLFHGSSFRNNPVSWQNLGNFGLLTDSVEAIQVINDNGLWYGFICNGHRLVRIEFGTTLWNNSPVATTLGTYNMNMAHCLQIHKEGTIWIGIVTCSIGSTIGRFIFGSSLANNPTYTNLGNIGSLFTPYQFFLVYENDLWYMILINGGNNTLSRLSFGSSLLNIPSGVNLGVINGMNTTIGLAGIRDCETTTGYFANYLTNGELGKLTFSGGVTGTVTGQVLGNIGSLNKPNCFSQIFREVDSLFIYLSNRGSATLTRLSFPPCSNASVPSSTLYNPPPYSYNSTGTYNIRLLVNEGLPNQASLCKNIVVGPAPVANLGADKTICPGTTTSLNAGSGFSSYLWSTGASTQTIIVGTPGTYWVRVTSYGCEDYDTVNVAFFSVAPLSLGPDTTICQGSTYTFNAGACAGCSFIWSNLTTGQPNIGTGPTLTTGTAGTYMVTRTDVNSCIKRDTAILSVEPPPVITTNPLSQTICSATASNIALTANLPGTTFSWTASCTLGNVTGFSPGAGNLIQQMLTNNGTTPGIVTYVITPALGNCIGQSENYLVTVNPVPTVTNNQNGDTLCSGDTLLLSLEGSTPGSSFTWTASGSSPGVSGFSGGSGDTILQALTNATFINQVVTYTIVATAFGCIGPPFVFAVLVRPVPDASLVPPGQSLCSGDTASFAIQGNVAGSIFSWTATNTAGTVTGFSNGSGASISQILQNQGTINGSVSYSVSSIANGCPGTGSTGLAVVFPVPDVYFTPSEDTICSNQNCSVFLSSHVQGATFSWTATGSSVNISGFSAGTGDQIAQYILNTGTQWEFVTYTVTPTANSCNGVPGSVLVRVRPLPEVTLSLCHDTVTTTMARPFPLRGGTPLQGSYSGPGISQGILYPALAGAGIHTVTYSYTNRSGCSSQASRLFSILNAVPHTCGNSMTDIRDGAIYPTVQIGAQCWLARNLNYGNFTLSQFLQRDNCIPEKFCLNEAASNCSQYGGLYQWDEMMGYSATEQIQGLCPPGWHIPSEPDWNILFTHYINNAFAASPLLYSGYSGFNALLAGTRFINRVWDFEGFATLIWSSTSHGPFKAWAHGMNDYDHGVSFYPAYRLNAFSVRCLRD